MKKTFKLSILAILVVAILLPNIACVLGPQGIKVTVDLQNGTEPTVYYVSEGGTLELPEAGEQQYKTFRGWSKSNLFFSEWDESTPITSEITIYAYWEKIPAEVSFELNYEGAPKIDTQSKNLGEFAMKPTVPERECWEFLGWFTDEALSVPFVWSDPITSEKLTLYAGWKLEDAHVHDYVTVTTPSCLSDGYDTHTCRCGDYYIDNKLPMSGHSFDFTNADYFEMIYCGNKGCNAASRRESERIYDDDFVYDFNDEKKTEIDGRYDQLTGIIDTLTKYDETLHGFVKDSERYLANEEFEVIYEAFYDDINYVIEQYQYAYVFYCVDESSENTEIYDFISEYRTEMISDFYTLYRLVYETEYREYFFSEEDGWTEEDIQKALVLSDSYGNEEYKEINDRINEIEIAFRDLSYPSSSPEVPKMYEEFVKLNNQIAKLAGYDNYIEYAYENVYNRDYTPEETAAMRDFVKENFKDIFHDLYFSYAGVSNNPPASGTEAYSTYYALKNASIFSSAKATELVKSYFETMSSTTAGDKEIDFYAHANDLFKNGNYYTGKYEGAFSYWVDAKDTSILYFGPGSYSGPFTFIHEYGHYYQNVYNGGISISYDLEEIYSQANEMMFLAYLEDHLDADMCREIYDDIYYDNIFNSMAIVMLATAVDEFEYCVYTNTAPDGTPKEYTSKDYDQLFKDIMASYGIDEILNSSYWRYVVIEAPCYYISYAMSAIPCLELLTIADTEGFEAAKEIYLNFFTFTDDEANVEIDEMGDKIVKIGYAETLEYAGLTSIFDAEVYSRIVEYFS